MSDEDAPNEMLDTAKLRQIEAETAVSEIEAKKSLLELARLERSERYEAHAPYYHHIYEFWSPVNGASVTKTVYDLGTWSRANPGQPLKVVFNSPGGSIIDGLALFDFLRQLADSGHHITTVAIGMAASMGGVLLQAGDHRQMTKHSRLLIHEASMGTGGKISEIEDYTKYVKSLQSDLLEILASRSTMTKRQIATRWSRTDWWLDASTAVKLGFADEVAA